MPSFMLFDVISSRFPMCNSEMIVCSISEFIRSAIVEFPRASGILTTTIELLSEEILISVDQRYGNYWVGYVAEQLVDYKLTNNNV